MFFRGDYYVLSNMFPVAIEIDGQTFSCVEAAFQACKTFDRDIRQKFVGLNGFEAKKLGRRIPLRPDWEQCKVAVMKRLLKDKFDRPGFAAVLIGTPEPIVEDNTWGDTFWGRCNGRGRNMLGQLLSEVKREILYEVDHKRTV